MPTLNFCRRSKVDVSRKKFFISEFLKSSQNYTELLRGSSETTGLSDTWVLEMLNKPLSLPGFSARWAQLSSFSWFHCSVGTAVGDVGCDPCQQHRGTCQAHNIVHFTGLQASVCFLSGQHVHPAGGDNVFSTLKVLKQCTWLAMRRDLQSFSISHNVRHTHTSVYNYATSRSVHSW